MELPASLRGCVNNAKLLEVESFVLGVAFSILQNLDHGVGGLYGVSSFGPSCSGSVVGMFLVVSAVGDKLFFVYDCFKPFLGFLQTHATYGSADLFRIFRGDRHIASAGKRGAFGVEPND